MDEVDEFMIRIQELTKLFESGMMNQSEKEELKIMFEKIPEIINILPISEKDKRLITNDMLIFSRQLDMEKEEVK